jgi:hypothetical protein
MQNHPHEAIPGKDRLTVLGVPEKTQLAAAADVEHLRTLLPAFPTNTFAAETLLDADQAAAIVQIHPN